MRRWLPFRTILGVLVVGLALYLLCPEQGSAEKATRQEMKQVCTNWLSYIVYQKGGWGGEVQPRIVGVEEVIVGEQVLALNFSIAPRGHVVVPVLKNLPPIKAYSDEYDLNLDECGGFAQLLREVLQHRADLFSQAYGSLEATQPATGEVIFDRVHREQWDHFSVDSTQFTSDLKAGVLGEMYEGRPLLATAWHQEDPYNDSCPWGDRTCVTCPDGQQPTYRWPSLVGCVATATAQIMNYHQWPQDGIGTATYWWNGDQTCSTATAGCTLSATFSDPYDWANMPDRCESTSPQAQKDAVAELCYEVGVAYNMDYGICCSAAPTCSAIAVLPRYFRYSPNIWQADRKNYNADTWFDFIRDEINRGRPMLYRIQYDPSMGHAIVCDGWRDMGAQKQYHVNYGWGGPYTGWYTIDKIHHAADTLGEFLIHGIKPAKTLSVCHDGTQPFVTIRDAIAAASDGDVIELCDGRYTGWKNRGNFYNGKKIIIRSKSGHAEACTIDCQGQGPAFIFVGGDSLHSVLQGVTITNGRQTSRGGAIDCNNSAPTITGCIFTCNSSYNEGGAIFCYNSSPNLAFCTFSDNSAGSAGGGLATWTESSLTLRHCTFSGNTARTWGGGIHLEGGPLPYSPCSVKVDNCLFYNNQAGLDGGGMASFQKGVPTLTDCVFWGNSAMDGGGLTCRDESVPELLNCTFYGNSASRLGGGMFLLSTSPTKIENTIVSFSTQGEGIYSQNSTPYLKCSDIYGNAGGNWQGYPFADQLNLRGNMEADPLFVNADSGDFSLQPGSPCAPSNSPSGCGLIGTLGLSPEVSGEISNLLIPNTDQCVNPGDYVCLPILLDNNTTPFGGFELEVEFDYTFMTFVSAEPGELIEGFEYFTYRLLPCPACGCCKHKILLYGQYDLPNGAENVGDPIGLTPIGEFHELAQVCFVVNSDENLRGLRIPVCWEWEGTVANDTLVEDWECGENTFSSWSGETLYTSAALCQFNADICDDPAEGIQPVLIFQNGICGQNCGGIDVCPVGPGQCKRGDINLNTITYEVADAVLFARYHVEGMDAFSTNPTEQAAQVCATDANADGRPLTLSDLVYLIRVILQDAVALPKLASPSLEVATMVVSDGTVAVKCPIPVGALLFEFDGKVKPTLLAEGMEIMADDNRVLVWSRKGNSIQDAEVLGFSGAQLTSVSAVDRDSRELEVSIVRRTTPGVFALNSAYPNPFNPTTNLSFSLPEAASYNLRIYNVAGRLVRSYDGMGVAGLNVIVWDGKDNSGVDVSSGVYFYKLTAGGNYARRKMVVIK